MAEAKAAWDAYPQENRSIRGVIKAMAESGLRCSITTLQRWITSEWALKGRSPPEKIQSAVEIAKVTKQVVERIAERQGDIKELMSDLKQQHIQILADHADVGALAVLAARERLAAQIVLARCISGNADYFMTEKPMVAVQLMEVLNAPMAPTGVVMGGNGDDARVVNGAVIDESPTAIALRQFKARSREGVAA